MDYSGNPYSVLAGNIMAPADSDQRLEDVLYDDVESQGTPFFSDDDPCIAVHYHISSRHTGLNRAFMFPCGSASAAITLTFDIVL